MFDPNNSGMVQAMAANPTKMHGANSGTMQTMTALGGQPVRPVRPTSPFAGMSGADLLGADMQGMMQQFRQDMGGYRDDMRDWRSQYLDSLRGNHGPMGHNGQGPVQGLPTPAGAPVPAQIPGQPANIMAPGMVGQSLYARNMVPGATPFDLPTY